MDTSSNIWEVWFTTAFGWGKTPQVPNINGIRKQLIDEMKMIKAPVVRYPGGCFADSYDWQDGIGPAINVRGEQIFGWK